MTISADPFSFFTKEGSTSFKIRLSCKLELNEANVSEVTDKASRLPNDSIVIAEGLNIRYSFTSEQVEIIKNLIYNITKNDYDYCIENDIIGFSKHIVNDYVIQDPSVLIKRGWDTDEEELYSQIIHMLCNVTNVLKAKIHFKEDGESKLNLVYSVVGEHEGYRGEIAFSFASIHHDDGTINDNFLVVTIIERKKIS